MPNPLYDYADPEHPLLQPGPETGAGLGGEVGPGNAYDALMGYVRRVMATDPVAVQQALRDQAAAERQRSYDMGYADPVTGLPTAKGAADIAGQWGRGVMLGTTAPGGAPGITAYHGSPHSFDRFDIGKIGTGEGAQAYGHGLYFAEREGVAKSYRDTLADKSQRGWFYPIHDSEGGTLLDAAPPMGRETTEGAVRHIAHVSSDGPGAPIDLDRAAAEIRRERDLLQDEPWRVGQRGGFTDASLAGAEEQFKQWENRGPVTGQPPAGHMYEVNIAADPEHFLHWDKPLSEQSPYVQDAVADLAAKLGVKMGNATGARAHADLADALYTGSRAEGDGWTTVTPTRYGDPAAAAQALREAGIPGIRYYDQGSRAAGEGSHNYVVFDAATLDILRKYGIAGLIAGGGATAATNALNENSDYTMPWADPRMERRPGAGAFTPIVPQPNLNQSPGQYPTGELGS